VSIEFKSVVAFAIIVLVLCFRPSGLFARHYVKRYDALVKDPGCHPGESGSRTFWYSWIPASSGMTEEVFSDFFCEWHRGIGQRGVNLH